MYEIIHFFLVYGLEIIGAMRIYFINLENLDEQLKHLKMLAENPEFLKSVTVSTVVECLIFL